MVQKQPETPSEIIKAARDKSDLTVEELTDRVGITERYLYRIENEGKIPTFEVLKKIVRELAIDGNLIFYPEKQVKDSEVEDLVRMLYGCDDRSLKIIRATVKAALESQQNNRSKYRFNRDKQRGNTLCFSLFLYHNRKPRSHAAENLIADAVGAFRNTRRR